MPSITNQKPTPRQTAMPSNGDAASVLSGVVSASTLRRSWMKVLLYGRNRVGKSTLSAQWPKKLLAIACEPRGNGGADSILGVEGVDVAVVGLQPLPGENLAGSAKVLTLVQTLEEMVAKTGRCPYQSITIDATALQDIILAEIMGWESTDVIIKRPSKGGGGVGRAVFMERADKTREVLRKVAALPCHVIFLAQEKDHNPMKDEDGNAVGSKLLLSAQEKSFMAASLGQATVEWLHNACSHICQLYMDAEVKEERSMVEVAGVQQEQVIRVQTGRFTRRLRTSYHPNFAAGITSPDCKVVPEYIEAQTPKEMYEALVKVTQGVKVQQGKYL